MIRLLAQDQEDLLDSLKRLLIVMSSDQNPVRALFRIACAYTFAWQDSADKEDSTTVEEQFLQIASGRCTQYFPIIIDVSLILLCRNAFVSIRDNSITQVRIVYNDDNFYGDCNFYSVVVVWLTKTH